MRASLTLTYRFSDDPYDDFGWLEVAVSRERFSGCSGFWVQWQDVKAFGEELSAYPIARDRPIKAAWGYQPWVGDSLAISIEVMPADVRGNLKVRVQLCDRIGMEIVGEGEPSACLRTTFMATYADIEAFRLAIEQLIDRNVDEAVLIGRY